MLQIKATWLLIGTLVIAAGGMKYLSWRVDSLKTDLETMTQVAESNKKAVESLQADFKNMQGVLDKYKTNRLDRDKSNQKMQADADRVDIVTKKPGLVEKQINASFDKLTQDFQEATK